MASDDDSSPPKPPNQAVFFPAYTDDYRIVSDSPVGYGVVANRNIKKGTIIYDESLELNFADVIEGDKLIFDGYKKASKKGTAPVPQYFPLTRDILTRTHGVPTLIPDPTGETAGTISWQLEVPGMFMNHSCDPTACDYMDKDDYAKAEGKAARDVKKGEELTADYVLIYYDHGPFFEKCMCKSSNCRGKMMGFKGLSDEEKKKLLPQANEAVRAMYLAETGEGKPVKREQLVFPPRDDSSSVMRLVCFSPGSALAPVEVKKKGDDDYALYALKDFRAGQMVYYFWCQPWPEDVPETIDMVFPSSFAHEGDPPEGTVVRIDASKWAVRSAEGPYKFSGWELLTAHSDNPNVEYKDEDSDEEEVWRRAYAVKDIKVGDKMTVDFNRVREASATFGCCTTS